MNKFMMFFCVLGMSTQMALAADGGKKASSMKVPTMTVEQRQKMADAHEKMAVCLRTDKAMSDCRDEMRAACQDGLGKDGCLMMGGGMGHGMHHGEQN